MPWKKSVSATFARYSFMQITRASFPLIPFRYPVALHRLKINGTVTNHQYVRIIIQEETEGDTSRIVSHIGAVADGHKSHSLSAKTTKEIPGLLRSPGFACYRTLHRPPFKTLTPARCIVPADAPADATNRCQRCTCSRANTAASHRWQARDAKWNLCFGNDIRALA